MASQLEKIKTVSHSFFFLGYDRHPMYNAMHTVLILPSSVQCLLTNIIQHCEWGIGIDRCERDSAFVYSEGRHGFCGIVRADSPC